MGGRIVRRTAIVAAVLAAGAVMAPTQSGAQGYESLCVGTPLAGSAACVRLGELDAARERVEARVPKLPSEDFYPMPAPPREVCTEPVLAYHSPDCEEWRGISDETAQVVAKLLAMAKSQQPVAAPSGDVGLPVILVTGAPARVETDDEIIRITGLVGDDGSPPRLKVDGAPAPLFRPDAGDARIAAHTMAFDVEVPIGAPGRQRIILEACDAAGNCAAERALVTVVASAAPAPAPVPATPEVDLDALVAKLKEQQLLAAPADTTLPRIRVDAPAEIDVGDATARITGLVGDDGSPPRLKVNGTPEPLYQVRAGDEGLAQNTLAFDIAIDAEAAGVKNFVLEACDGAGNCVAEGWR